jgi:hypothetical protein
MEGVEYYTIEATGTLFGYRNIQEMGNSVCN